MRPTLKLATVKSTSGQDVACTTYGVLIVPNLFGMRLHEQGLPIDLDTIGALFIERHFKAEQRFHLGARVRLFEGIA